MKILTFIGEAFFTNIRKKDLRSQEKFITNIHKKNQVHR